MPRADVKLEKPWGRLLLILLVTLPTVILTAQGVSYLSKWGPGDVGTCTWVRAGIHAWRDNYTGYICSFSSDGRWAPYPGWNDDRCLYMKYGGDKLVYHHCGYGSSASGAAIAWTYAQIGASYVRDALDYVEVPPWG